MVLNLLHITFLQGQRKGNTPLICNCEACFWPRQISIVMNGGCTLLRYASGEPEGGEGGRVGEGGGRLQNELCWGGEVCEEETAK